MNIFICILIIFFWLKNEFTNALNREGGFCEHFHSLQKEITRIRIFFCWLILGLNGLYNIMYLMTYFTLVFMLSIQYKIFRFTNWLICFHSKSKGISPFEAILIKTVSRVAKTRITSRSVNKN